MTKKLFIRFILVGILNTLFGYGVFALLVFLGVHYSLAAFAGTVLGILFNFKTTGKLVFGVSDNKLLFRFFGVYGATYCLNVLGLKLLSALGIDYYTGGALLLLPMAAAAFALNRFYVFNKAAPAGD